MRSVEHLVQTESGPRFAKTGSYKGWAIEVAAGWDVISDLYRMHVYVTRPGAARQKINTGNAPSLQAAFDAGFAIAASWVDAQA